MQIDKYKRVSTTSDRYGGAISNPTLDGELAIATNGTCLAVVPVIRAGTEGG